jgi:hypothetical protein
VLDITGWWAGPSATGALAHLGADVIHVESHKRLDGMRVAAGALFSTQPTWWERSWFFLQINTNKRELTLDLTTERGRDILLEMVKDVDLVVGVLAGAFVADGYASRSAVPPVSTLPPTRSCGWIVDPVANADAVAAFGTLRRKSIEDALLIATRRGNRDATVALADMYLAGLPFGEKADRAQALLKPLAKDGDGAAALQVALIAIGDDPARPGDGAVAREMLLLAAASPDLVAQSTAKNLLLLLPAEPAKTATTEGVTQ